jgi:hypothetical protein
LPDALGSAGEVIGAAACSEASLIGFEVFAAWLAVVVFVGSDGADDGAAFVAGEVGGAALPAVGAGRVVGVAVAAAA